MKKRKPRVRARPKPGPKGPPPVKIEGDPGKAFTHFLNAKVWKEKAKPRPKAENPKG